MSKLDQITEIRSGHPQDMVFEAYKEAGISLEDLWQAVGDADEAIAYNDYLAGETCYQ